jgi:predicted 3-demethylubiquinone-9 3-methyltransferase (glyoxalase superfamily)
MKKITPHLWFNKEAKEAVEFYCSVFPNSKIKSVQTLHDTPSGDADVVSFELDGTPFMAISAGPYFKINPSISFTVVCRTKEEIDGLWQKLNTGGKTLMPLQNWFFSEYYGWTQDKYGVSWQIIIVGEGIASQRITPHLMFTEGVCGKAEEAINFYTSIFPNSQIEGISRYGADQAPDKEGAIAHALFKLNGQELGAMDSAQPHGFTFNEGVSLIVPCDDQGEIDYYWEKLSAVPEAEQCGWLKDKYGLSWQIVPTAMNKMMAEGTPEEIDRVTQAFLKMKKFDIAELERAKNAL